MGVKNANCDDAKTNLTLDWNGSFSDYVCFHPRTRIYPDDLIEPVLEYESIPESYMVSYNWNIANWKFFLFCNIFLSYFFRLLITV